MTVPMRHRFRQAVERHSVLIRGPAGWGEFSPFPEYPPGVAASWLAAALEAAVEGLPAPGRARIPVNVTVPALPPDVARTVVERSGASTAKVKVAEPGTVHADDMARLDAVRGALGPEGRIRIDANGAWSLEEAESRIESLSVFALEYVEQPVATIEEMVQLRSLVDIPLAADELVRSVEEPIVVAESGGADILVLKVQPLGGVRRALDIADECGLPVVISSALETSIGLYPGLVAASLLPELDYACGLGTIELNEVDPTREPLVPSDGWLDVRRPEPDPSRLRSLRPDSALAAEMMRRVFAVAEVLG